MWKSLRCAVVLGALGLAAIACTAGSGPTGIGGGGSEPSKQASVTSPTSGLVVTATISAVTLGDQCAASSTSSGFAGDCAPAPTQMADAGAEGGAAKSPPSNTGCGGPSYCQQSNVQIAFTAGAGTQSAKVEIVTVTLLDSATDKVVDTLKASHPQVWSGNAYASWDESIKPAGDLKASYDLSAPAWSTLSGTSDSRTTSSYSTKYKLLVTLRIDGVEITLESTDLSREPPVAT
jgi:hypothetical protein